MQVFTFKYSIYVQLSRVYLKYGTFTLYKLKLEFTSTQYLPRNSERTAIKYIFISREEKNTTPKIVCFGN